MLSSRGYYDAPVFYRRSEAGLHMPLAQDSPLDSYESSSQLSRRTTPSSDADKPGTGPRKRVPVACERCRKRKIKCSGDEGGSCSNCRNAGVGGCQFLRVSSIDADMLRVGAMRHAMSARTAWPGSHRYSPYPSPYRHSNYATSPPSYTHHAQNGYSNQNLQSGAEFTYAVSPQNQSWTRSTPYSTAYTAYDEQTSPYSSHGPPFILPNADPMGAGGAYSYTKPQSMQLLQEPQTQVANQQSIPQLMTTPYSMSSYEQSLPYHTLSNSNNNPTKSDHTNPYHAMVIPQPTALASDRTLPNPSTRQYSLGQVSTLETLPMSAGTLSHRSSIGWTTDTSSRSSHISSQTSCSSAGGYADSNTDKYSGHRNSQDLSYAYLPIASSSQSALSSTTLSSALSESQQPHVALMPTVSELDQARCRTVSQDSLHESPNTNTSSYGYANSTVARNAQSRNTSGHLSNGATYTRAQQSCLTRTQPAAEECGPECSGYPTNSSRTSIASINNVGSY